MKLKNTIIALLIMIIAISTSISAVSAADITINTGTTAAGLQAALDAALSGDNIIFANEFSLDLADQFTGFNITKTLNFIGNGAKFNMNAVAGNATASIPDASIFNLKTIEGSAPSGTTFNGFNFTFNGTSGAAISIAEGTRDILVNDTTFNGGYAGIDSRLGSNITATENLFNKTYRGLNVLGGTDYTITNNIFLNNGNDAVSLAQSAQNIVIANNSFNGSDWDLFFGGGVLNTQVTNNIFNGTKGTTIMLVKSAEDILIENNDFRNGAGGILIASDTSHGYGSIVSNVTITQNRFENMTGTKKTTGAIVIDPKFRGGNSGITNFRTDDMGVLVSNNTVTNVAGGYLNLMANTNSTVIVETLKKQANILGDPSATYRITSGTPALKITSTQNSAAIKNGDVNYYTVTVTNNGKAATTGVVAKDLFNSAYFTGASLSATKGSLSGTTWNVGSLAAGESASITLKVTAKKAGSVSTKATVTSDYITNPTQNTTLAAETNIITKTINKYVKIVKSYAASTKVKRNKYATVKTKLTNSGKDGAYVTVTYKTSANLGKKGKTYTYTKKVWVAAGKTVYVTKTFKMYTKGTKKAYIYVDGKKVSTKSIRGY